MIETNALRTSFSIGEEASFTKTFTQEEVELFSRLSGDTNPIHLDEAYARSTRFGGRIIHGMLVASLISTVLGTELPGPGCIYLGQELSFRSPARVGERLTARVRVTDWDGVKGRVKLATQVIADNGTEVVTGEARLLIASFLK